MPASTSSNRLARALALWISIVCLASGGCSASSSAGDADAAGVPPDGSAGDRADLSPIHDSTVEQAASDLLHDDAPVDAQSADTVNPYAGLSCSTPPPAGATLAADPPAYSGGSCPQLVAGVNTIDSGGDQRQFILVLPASPQPDESFPVLFAWHWLKGDADGFLDKGEIQQATDDQRFIAVIPEKKGGVDLFGLAEMPWPFTTLDTDERMAEEYLFFDDMLACVSEQFPVNKECVSTVGVSAGALFSNQLAAARSQHLASFISLSGGVGGGGGVNDFIRTWNPPTRKLPALVLWGGPADSCVLLNFQVASQQLEQQLIADGHFFVECVHNCKHGEPPLDPPEGVSRYAPIWDFVFAHPFWLPAGASPLHNSGAPVSYIDWCGIGASSATIRTGDCPPPGCPI